MSDTQSTWTFKGDIGIMQKTVKLQIDITEWKEPSLVTFDITGSFIPKTAENLKEAIAEEFTSIELRRV